jgi:hypothetical protein
MDTQIAASLFGPTKYRRSQDEDRYYRSNDRTGWFTSLREVTRIGRKADGADRSR